MRNLSEQKFSEMIYAFSIGCLDKDEYLEFLAYIHSGQKMPETELGELQNVVSLLPAMLELERPELRVKDKVARRLYQMREELRAKKKQAQMETPQEEVRPINENTFSGKLFENEAEIKTEVLPEITAEIINETQPENRIDVQTEKKVTPSLKTTGRMTLEIPTLEAAQAAAAEEKPSARREISEAKLSKEREVYTLKTTGAQLKDDPKEKSGGALKENPEKEEEEEKNPVKSILVLVSALLFVLVAGVVVYFVMSHELHQDKAQIQSLSGQIDALNSEMMRLDRNQKVLAVLSAKDLRTINLDGTASNAGGFGKLTLLQNGKEGVIQFYNMPPLKGNEVYQLWLLSKGRYYSLGTFRTKREIEYFPFSNPEVDQASIDSYSVTLENGEGKTSPSEKVYLLNAFKE